MSNLFDKIKGDKVASHHTYGLTPLGKTKAEEFGMAGTRGEVVSYLNDNGASSINEITSAGEVKASADKIKAVIRGLMREGYVRRVSSEG